MTWAEKYRARTISDLIISGENLKTIIGWLNRWRSGDVDKKAIILYGPPGTGKTTALSVIGKEMGLQVIEMNASERRNADHMKMTATMGALYRDISDEKPNRNGPDRLILIDEADNIFEGRSAENGGDTGGIKALSEAIEETRNPIALTMNEFYDFRRKNSAMAIVNNSIEVDFRPYRKKKTNEYNEFRRKMRARIDQILKEEGVEIPESFVIDVMNADEPDIRSILNDLESLRYASGSEETGFKIYSRDAPKNIYNIMDKTFRSVNYDDILYSLRDKDFETEDYLMWIDQNLPDMETDHTMLYRSYDVLALADLYVARVYRKQHYAFKNYAEEMAAGVSFFLARENSHYVKFQFPDYIRMRGRIKNAGAGRKGAERKLARLNHVSESRIKDMMWFFDMMKRKAPKYFKSISEKLAFSPQEEASV